jgi:hypothetical protein
MRKRIDSTPVWEVTLKSKLADGNHMTGIGQEHLFDENTTWKVWYLYSVVWLPTSSTGKPQ